MTTTEVTERQAIKHEMQARRRLTPVSLTSRVTKHAGTVRHPYHPVTSTRCCQPNFMENDELKRRAAHGITALLPVQPGVEGGGCPRTVYQSQQIASVSQAAAFCSSHPACSLAIPPVQASPSNPSAIVRIQATGQNYAWPPETCTLVEDRAAGGANRRTTPPRDRSQGFGSEQRHPGLRHE